jgi:hypothetical protein
MQKNYSLIFLLCVLLLACRENREINRQTINDIGTTEQQELNDYIAGNNEETDDDNTSIQVINRSIRYFPILEIDETLAFLRKDSNTIRVYAISKEQKNHRLIKEFYDSVYWASRNQFSDDMKLGFIRVMRVGGNSSHSPLYFINGTTGRIIHLFDTSSIFTASNDGRFVAVRTDIQGNPNMFSIFDIEKGKVAETFLWETELGWPLILRDGRSNFRVFGGAGHVAIAEAEIDTYTSELRMIREGDWFSIGERYPFNYDILLNNSPRLRHKVGINMPHPEIGQRFLLVSEDTPLFSEPDNSAEIITVMEEGQELEVLEIGYEVVVDNIRSYWVKVRLWHFDPFNPWPSDIVGWCFLGLLIY